MPSAQHDHGHAVAALGAVARPEGAGVGALGEVAAHRRLQRAGPVAVDDRSPPARRRARRDRGTAPPGAGRPRRAGRAGRGSGAASVNGCALTASARSSCTAFFGVPGAFAARPCAWGPSSSRDGHPHLERAHHHGGVSPATSTISTSASSPLCRARAPTFTSSGSIATGPLCSVVLGAPLGDRLLVDAPGQLRRRRLRGLERLVGAILLQRLDQGAHLLPRELQLGLQRLAELELLLGAALLRGARAPPPARALSSFASRASLLGRVLAPRRACGAPPRRRRWPWRARRRRSAPGRVARSQIGSAAPPAARSRWPTRRPRSRAAAGRSAPCFFGSKPTRALTKRSSTCASALSSSRWVVTSTTAPRSSRSSSTAVAMRRALARVGVGGDLVDQHQRALASPRRGRPSASSRAR